MLQDVGMLVQELKTACEALPRPELCDAEKLVLLKVFTTVVALLLKLEQHKDLPLRPISLTKLDELILASQERLAMPRAALADPLAWLQAQLQLPRCSGFLNGVSPAALACSLCALQFASYCAASCPPALMVSSISPQNTPNQG